MTYADKYALLKAYKIVTGDDPDQKHSPDIAEYNKAESKIDNLKASALKMSIEKANIDKAKVDEIIGSLGYNEIKDIQNKDYKLICDHLKALKDKEK